MSRAKSFRRFLRRNFRRSERRERQRVEREAKELKRLNGKFRLWVKLNPKEEMCRCAYCPHRGNKLVPPTCPKNNLVLDMPKREIRFSESGGHQNCVEWIRHV